MLMNRYLPIACLVAILSACSPGPDRMDIMVQDKYIVNFSDYTQMERMKIFGPNEEVIYRIYVSYEIQRKPVDHFCTLSEDAWHHVHAADLISSALIKPENFCSEFDKRLSQLAQNIRNSP